MLKVNPAHIGLIAFEPVPLYRAQGIEETVNNCLVLSVFPYMIPKSDLTI